MEATESIKIPTAIKIHHGGDTNNIDTVLNTLFLKIAFATAFFF